MLVTYTSTITLRSNLAFRNKHTLYDLAFQWTILSSFKKKEKKEKGKFSLQFEVTAPPTIWFRDSLTLLKINEDPKELLLMGVMSIDIYHMKNPNWGNLKIFTNLKINPWKFLLWLSRSQTWLVSMRMRFDPWPPSVG